MVMVVAERGKGKARLPCSCRGYCAGRPLALQEFRSVPLPELPLPLPLLTQTASVCPSTTAPPPAKTVGRQGLREFERLGWLRPVLGLWRAGLVPAPEREVMVRERRMLGGKRQALVVVVPVGG